MPEIWFKIPDNWYAFLRDFESKENKKEDGKITIEKHGPQAIKEYIQNLLEKMPEGMRENFIKNHKLDEFKK